MVFSSSTFLIFFLPAVLLGYYLIQPRFRNAFLLVSSLLFYAWGEPRFVLVMMLSILCNYLFALGIHASKARGRTQAKALLVCAAVFNIGILILFKYTNFILFNLHRFFSGVRVTSIALPIGISFFTFQALSYVIDVYRGEEVQKNPAALGLYISFFPQLIAGPIVRYNTISSQLSHRKETWEDFCDGTERFLVGLFKKILLANNLSVLADAAFSADMRTASVCFVWLGALAYAFQIYFDFSGYSDMAIGLGRMFGFRFGENFNYPYTAGSITDFWRRWHISLSSWFRDYVYIPLGGSRVGSKGKHIRNLFIVWLLTGAWHGARWSFVLWGLVYFVLLVLEKYVIKPAEFHSPAAIAAYRCLSLLAVLFCWVLFRAESFSGAVLYMRAMIGLTGNPLTDQNFLFYSREYMTLLAAAAVGSTPAVKNAGAFLRRKCGTVVFGALKTIVFVFLLLVSLSYLVLGAHNPFIYFNF